jgi:hypothetical protein
LQDNFEIFVRLIFQEHKKREAIGWLPFFIQRSRPLLNVTTFTAGRPAGFLVARFALLVESVLGFRSFGAIVTTGTRASVNAFVVTFCTVSNFSLVSLVSKSNGTHFSFEGDGFRAIVGDGDCSDAQKADGNQSDDNAFHTLPPLKIKMFS